MQLNQFVRLLKEYLTNVLQPKGIQSEAITSTKMEFAVKRTQEAGSILARFVLSARL